MSAPPGPAAGAARTKGVGCWCTSVRSGWQSRGVGPRSLRLDAESKVRDKGADQQQGCEHAASAAAESKAREGTSADVSARASVTSRDSEQDAKDDEVGRAVASDECTPTEQECVRRTLRDPRPAPPLWYEELPTTLPYRETNGGFRPALHVGQRKLFVAELRFLTDVLRTWRESATVVYVGAASGSHLPALAALFPNVSWHLYDPAPFAPELAAVPGVHLTRGLFTQQHALAWRARGCDLFISDARLGNAEQQVAASMTAQAEWLETIRPRRAAMLKFRPPYGSGSFTYLAGRVMLQCWAPTRSSEARLILRFDHSEQAATPSPSLEGKAERPQHPLPRCVYDHGAYENAMYYLNAVLREWAFYPHTVRGEGVDHCYDCAHEVAAWEAYLRLRDQSSSALDQSRDTARNVATRMDELTHRLGRPLLTSRHAHGHEPDVPMHQKRERLRERFA